MNIQYCLDKASETPYKRGETRHYSVILDRKGRVVGEGRNMYHKTHPMAYKASKRIGNGEKCSTHAELAALLSDRYKKGVKLIVGRVDSNNASAYSEPCENCKYIIREYFPNIKSVEYSI